MNLILLCNYYVIVLFVNLASSSSSWKTEATFRDLFSGSRCVNAGLFDLE